MELQVSFEGIYATGCFAKGSAFLIKKVDLRNIPLLLLLGGCKRRINQDRHLLPVAYMSNHLAIKPTLRILAV